MDKLVVLLAYQYVAVSMMLAEVNYCASQLDLNVPKPILTHHIQASYVSRPLLSGFGGMLETTNYAFGFSSGKLRFITKRETSRASQMSIRDRNLELSMLSSKLDTNGAYALATQWLRAISVDVDLLERSCQLEVKQRYFYPDATGINSDPSALIRKTLLPIFDVVWKQNGRPAVSVAVFGPTGELLELRQEDLYFSRRPEVVIKDLDSLLLISDSEFLRYGPEQRKNLLQRFSAVDYKRARTNSVVQPAIR